ncbi:MAG: intradiol ring-cleavage dioxygenase [Minwuia sp.]|uniref:intradiol ring-cleavage dioxygenase n=1 Tax=Minwuia sp. TaxID=2493630 RepID=UPI003A88CAD5
MTGRATRRQALAAAIATIGATLLPRSLRAKDVSVALIGNGVCTLTPETTAGPFYLDEDLVRQDIREDRAGVPLRLRLQVVDAACRPLPDARVDVWHCDAGGVYSAFGMRETGRDGMKDETFLRGTLFADSAGIVEFTTVYPGWYLGRTPHIHFKAFPDSRSTLTGQIFLPDAVSDRIYGSAPAYMREATRRATNANDRIAQRAGDAALAALSEADGGYLAEMVIGVGDS